VFGNVNDSARQNSITEINGQYHARLFAHYFIHFMFISVENETDCAAHSFEALCNYVGDYYDRKHKEIEQPPEESSACSVDLLASNEQFQATAANDPVDSMLLSCIQ